MKVTPDSCGGDDRWPPGFRFHPTDEELVVYYLKRKMCRRRLRLHIIAELDVYKWDPEELPGQSILKTGDRQWFFFSPRDRKYPNGARSNRATSHGYWKATGKDRNITCNSRTVGLKKTLVFYRGRAPNGERTDWVMHEYTLDEEELKRCQNVKDYYALYKVYKKSGPGPKNGEQYGAPFKEEDWVDDECAAVNGAVDYETPAKQFVDVSPLDNERVNAQVWAQSNGMEEFMSQIADEPLPLQEQVNDFAEIFQGGGGEEDNQSTLMEPSLGDVIFPMPVRLLPPSVLQSNEQASFDFSQSATSKPQVCEQPEVTSATNKAEPVTPVGEDDYLEIDDLLSLDFTISNVEKPVQNFQNFEDFENSMNFQQFDELDGFGELDLFHDAAMFLHEMGPIVSETVSHSFAEDPCGNGTGNQANYHLQSDSLVNQMDYHLQPNAVVTQVEYQLHHSTVLNQVDFQLQEQTLSADQMSSDLMTHEQRNVLTTSASNQEVVTLPSSGVVHMSTNLLTETNQNQNGGENAESSWLSSALWSFVDSIPTTPASASESPLVNRAFGRMSSFSRVRLNSARSNIVAVANNAATVRRGGSVRVLLLFSILGALIAILWVLIGTMGLLGRCISL
ncbi:NAM domain-containing protein [Cephalotus follicularis]|uniref:NAM domain-containing protein n=1 Tax=Cephalotus follicularis TaxID=3775 RepID=A0A1Q3BW29_CEPFO|nr:NAM domain-containing protein [Cephalotus follicularis]